MKNGDIVYYIDLDRGLIKGELKKYDEKYKKAQVWATPMMGRILSKDRIGSTEEEAIEGFEKWKVRYKDKLLNNNKWIQELFEDWEYSREDSKPKEMVKIMQEIIKEKIGIEVD